MDFSAETEKVLRELVRDAREMAARAAREAETFEAALALYLSKFDPVPAPPLPPRETALRTTEMHARPPDSPLLVQMKHGSYRQMLRAWAEDHDGHVVVKELVQAALDSGRFDSRQKAHKTMWSTITQAAKKGEFERVDEGVYEARPVPWTDEQRANREAEGEVMLQALKLQVDASSPAMYTEPNMPPERRVG